MTLVPQTKRQKIINLFAEVENRIHSANNKLRIEQEDRPEYDTAYKAGLDTSAKTDLAECVQLIRWLIDNLGLPTPAAFTDNEIDAINPLIRQYNDGVEP